MQKKKIMILFCLAWRALIVGLFFGAQNRHHGEQLLRNASPTSTLYGAYSYLFFFFRKDHIIYFA